MKWLRNPVNVFMVGLIIFGFIALLYNFRLEVWLSSAAIVLGAGLAYFALGRTKLGNRHLWQNAVISTVIAVLILNPLFELSWINLLYLLLGGALVIGAKYFPSYRHQVIFNPVVAGLLALNYILVFIYGTEAVLPTFVSWWGTDFAGSYSLLVLIPLVFYGAYRFRKLPLLLIFLGLNALYLGYRDGLEAVNYIYTTGTIYFMAGVMMLEPKSSPIKIGWQAMAAVVAVLVYHEVHRIGLGNVELWAIVAVNMVHLISRIRWGKVREKLILHKHVRTE